MKTVEIWASLGLVVAALLLAPGPARAYCLTCTESLGVRAVLKDGGTVRGYLRWNRYRWFGRRIGVLDPAQWLAERNAALARAAESAEAAEEGAALELYGELRRIRYPGRRWVAVEGTVHDLAVGDIARLARDPELTLRVDTTGLPGLPRLTREEIRLLQTARPRHTVEVEDEAGAASVWVLYGEAVSLDEVLDHVMCHSQALRAVAVDRVRVAVRRDGGLALPTALPAEWTEPHRAVADFRGDLAVLHHRAAGLWQSFRDTAGELEAELRAVSDGTAARARRVALVEAIAELRAEYEDDVEALARGYCRALEDGDGLAARGVIAFQDGG